MADIDTYLASNPRNKIVFSQKALSGIDYVDVGYNLAKAIQPKLGKRTLTMFSAEKLIQILNDNQHIHPKYGKYVAISNIGILFEPSLRIDIHGVFEQNSKNQILFIHNPTTPFQGSFRLNDLDSKHAITISDLNPITIFAL